MGALILVLHEQASKEWLTRGWKQPLECMKQAAMAAIMHRARKQPSAGGSAPEIACAAPQRVMVHCVLTAVPFESGRLRKIISIRMG